MVSVNKVTNILKVEKSYLTVAETANYTGISERAIRDFLKDAINPLPHFRIGQAERIIRIRKSDIDNCIEHFKPKSQVNIDTIIDELIK